MKQKSTNNPNPHAIKRSIERRAKWLYIIFSFVALTILAQIVLTQFGPNGTALRNKSEDLCYTTRRVQGSRGNIYDRNGEILSTDSRTYNIRLDLAAEPLTDELFGQSVNTLADSLSRLLGKPSSFYRQLLHETRQKAVESKDTTIVKLKGKEYFSGARYKLLARHLNQREYDRLRTFPLMERRMGMIAEEERMRYKVYGSMAAYTISQGVEKAYDSLLRSTDGVNRYVKLDNRNRNSVPIVDKINRPATNGCDIHTTIDVNLQDMVEGALRNRLIENNALSGTAVVVECATGEIRAMANLTHRKNGEINDDFNYAIRWHGAPGSTFKGISLMALLDDAGVSKDKWVDCGKTGKTVINGLTITDTHVVGENKSGKTTVKGMFAESSNVGFAKVVCQNYEDNPQRWVDYIRGIGLDKVSHIQNIRGLKFYIKDPSTFHNKGGWSKTTLPQTAYGYEVNMTPLQILMFYNAVANNGKLVSPVLVKQVVSDGKVVEEYGCQVVNEQICSPTALADLRECMEAVVTSERGTGKALGKLPFKVAGKTGTAQVILPKERWGKNAYVTPDGTREYLATFVGYFPADDPKYTCIVSIKTERKSGEVKYYTGAGVSLPVFEDIAGYIYTHDPQWTTKAEHKINNSTLSAKPSARNTATYEGVVPNVVGMGLRDALYCLESAGLRVKFSGSGKVAKQSITPGTAIEEDTMIEIELKIEN